MENTTQNSTKITQRLKLFQFFEKNGDVKIYKKNSLIGGSPKKLALGVYYIKYGYVKVIAKDKDDNEFLELMYGKNDIFPLAALTTLFSGRLQYISVNRVKLYSVPAVDVREEFKKDIGLSTAMMHYVISNTLFLQGLLQNSKYKSAHDKLTFGLILIAIRFGDTDKDAVSLDKVFNHRLIGTMVNLSRETISREMSILRSKGLVYTQESQLVIIDLKKLEIELDKPLESSILEQIDNDLG